MFLCLNFSVVLKCSTAVSFLGKLYSNLGSLRRVVNTKKSSRETGTIFIVSFDKTPGLTHTTHFMTGLKEG